MADNLGYTEGADTLYIHTGTAAAKQGVSAMNVNTGVINGAGTVPFGHGTAAIGNRMEVTETEDGLNYLYVMRHTGQDMWRTLLFW